MTVILALCLLPNLCINMAIRTKQLRILILCEGKSEHLGLVIGSRVNDRQLLRAL